MSLPTLNFRHATYCSDPRCTTTRRCWRAENEDFGNAPGLAYGPGCIPASLPDGLTYEQGIAEGERRATERIVAWLRSKSDDPEAWWVAVFQHAADAIERGEHLRNSSGRVDS